MQRFLQFRLGCHGLPVAIGRLAGAGHVDRANRVCLACNSGAVGDEKHMIFECAAIAPYVSVSYQHQAASAHQLLCRHIVALLLPQLHAQLCVGILVCFMPAAQQQQL